MPLTTAPAPTKAVAVTVPLTNPVQGLTAAQVRQIYTGKLDNWKTLGGGDLAIVPLSRQQGALVWSAFEPWALGGQRLSPNSVMLSGDEAVVATLETEPGAIGYALLRSLNANVRPLRLDGEAPSAAAVQTGRYPLALAVAVFTNGPPSGGAADVPHAFTATVGPITTTQPITYFWQATGQTPVTRTDQGLTDTLAFTWSAAAIGPQLITVTAENSAGSVSTTYATTIVPPAVAGVTDISIIDFAFQPQAITITVGSSVRWINTGLFTHTTTSDVGSSQVWNSGELAPGGTFTQTFNTPGVYTYHCEIHSTMRGSVTVLTNVYLPLVLR